MKERPILFSSPMIRAIMSGNKTMTRRVVKPQFSGTQDIDWQLARGGFDKVCVLQIDSWMNEIGILAACPYGTLGDRLWVRETFSRVSEHYVYKADADENGQLDYGGTKITPKWKPSIHMPYEASRIMLEITDICVERLQDITIGDAAREGVGLSVENFKHQWRIINGPDSWGQNPFVWVMSFRRK